MSVTQSYLFSAVLVFQQRKILAHHQQKRSTHYVLLCQMDRFIITLRHLMCSVLVTTPISRTPPYDSLRRPLHGHLPFLRRRHLALLFTSLTWPWPRPAHQSKLLNKSDYMLSNEIRQTRTMRSFHLLNGLTHHPTAPSQLSQPLPMTHCDARSTAICPSAAVSPFISPSCPGPGRHTK